MTIDASDLPLYEQVVRRREQLGRELWAHVYVSDQEQAVLIAPIVYHSAPLEELERRRPAGATSIPLMYEAPGVRLPLEAPVAKIGREAMRALVATAIRDFDPWAFRPPPSQSFLYECAPDEATRHSYVQLNFGTKNAYWLTLAKVYDNLDDSELLLQAGVRLGCSEAEVGNWILRLFGAYRALERTHDTWWRPIPEEAGKGW